MQKVYFYKACDGCRRAFKWLDAQGVAVEPVAIRETPPSTEELASALGAGGGQLRRLFNTSGRDYRALGLKDRVPDMGQREAFELLRSNGNLVKRPFIATSRGACAGFDEAEWKRLLGL